MDQFIYFLNHLAEPAKNLSMHQRHINGIVFIASPLILGLLLIFGCMRWRRGNITQLKIIVSSLYIFCIILPFAVMSYSSWYLDLINQIPLFLLLYFVFAAFLTIGVEELYPRYCYKTDKEYKQKKFIDGYTIKQRIINAKKLLISNTIFFIAHLLMFFSVIIYFIERYSHVNAGMFSNMVIFIGAFMFFGYFVIFRYFSRCPYCHQTLYGFEGRRVKNYNKAYYFCTMLRILKYHRFTCMYCHGHFILGEHDIVKQRGWEIENLHEPDFTVVKKPQ